MAKRKLKFAMVCSSNQNRSMEAHALLKSKQFEVCSYGVGQRVKLPGPALDEPIVYDFGTPYAVMYKDLKQLAEAYYQKKGLLRMLERNATVKEAPERWQTSKQQFDVAVTFEERVMDQLVADMKSRPNPGVTPLLVVNLDVVDNHEEAAQAAPLTLKLCQMLEDADDLLDAVNGVLDHFQKETGKRVLHDVCFY